MKRLFAAIICTIALLVTWVSCNSNVTTAPEAVVFDSLFIDSICPLFRNYEQPACHITIRLDKPSSEHPASLVASMERALTTVPRDGSLVEASEGTLAGLAKAYVREFIFQYLLDGKEAIDSSEGNEREASSWMNYEENVEGRVLYNANGLVGYQFNIYSYSGGAHGNTQIRNCVFDDNHIEYSSSVSEGSSLDGCLIKSGSASSVKGCRNTTFCKGTSLDLAGDVAAFNSVIGGSLEYNTRTYGRAFTNCIVATTAKYAKCQYVDCVVTNFEAIGITD